VRVPEFYVARASRKKEQWSSPPSFEELASFKNLHCPELLLLFFVVVFM